MAVLGVLEGIEGMPGCIEVYWLYGRVLVCVYIEVYWGKPPISAAASVSPDWCRTGHRLYIYKHKYTNTNINENTNTN